MIYYRRSLTHSQLTHAKGFIDLIAKDSMCDLGLKYVQIFYRGIFILVRKKGGLGTGGAFGLQVITTDICH